MRETYAGLLIATAGIIAVGPDAPFIGGLFVFCVGLMVYAMAGLREIDNRRAKRADVEETGQLFMVEFSCGCRASYPHIGGMGVKLEQLRDKCLTPETCKYDESQVKSALANRDRPSSQMPAGSPKHSWSH